MKDWHFHRTEEAKQYLGLLDLGIVSSIAIIAPRRKGKTLFVLKDLAPLSQKRGYLPVYVSLWQTINTPHDGLITALQDAISNLDRKAPISRLLNAKVKKTTVSNELLGKMEVEFADNPVPPSSEKLAYCDQLLTQLEKRAGKKTVLLLIDEVQHLATSAKFDPLAHALRTMLDKRQGSIKSIFTGSSRHYLDLLLNESKSPFYHFVSQYEFPDLGEDFLAFIKSKMHKDYQISVSMKSLAASFQDLDLSPYWMMKLVMQMIAFKQSATEALDYTLQLMEATEDFEGIAQRLKPIDKVVFLALCRGTNPYSKELMTKVGKETSVKGVPSNIQRSIKRLSESALISQKGKEGYNIEKPGLRRYLEKRA